MNRHLRNRLQYHRHLANTLSALSATAVILVSTLMVAAPAQPFAAEAVARESTSIIVASTNTQADIDAMQAQAGEIEVRAEQRGTDLQKPMSAGEAIAHVAAFTAEVAIVAAVTAALKDLPESADSAEIAAPAPSHQTRKHKRNRQSLAMPYFSFASRS